MLRLRSNGAVQQHHARQDGVARKMPVERRVVSGYLPARALLVHVEPLLL